MYDPRENALLLTDYQLHTSLLKSLTEPRNPQTTEAEYCPDPWFAFVYHCRMGDEKERGIKRQIPGTEQSVSISMIDLVRFGIFILVYFVGKFDHKKTL